MTEVEAIEKVVAFYREAARESELKAAGAHALGFMAFLKVVIESSRTPSAAVFDLCTVLVLVEPPVDVEALLLAVRTNQKTFDLASKGALQ